MQGFVTDHAEMKVKMPKLTFIVVGKRYELFVYESLTSTTELDC